MKIFVTIDEFIIIKSMGLRTRQKFMSELKRWDNAATMDTLLEIGVLEKILCTVNEYYN